MVLANSACGTQRIFFTMKYPALSIDSPSQPLETSQGIRCLHLAGRQRGLIRSTTADERISTR